MNCGRVSILDQSVVDIDEAQSERAKHRGLFLLGQHIFFQLISFCKNTFKAFGNQYIGTRSSAVIGRSKVMSTRSKSMSGLRVTSRDVPAEIKAMLFV
jgi:hypothetical protein